MADQPDPIRLPIEDSLDLHTFAPRDVKAVLLDYLDAAHARGLLEVRIIHGKGIGVQRAIVQSTLDRHPLVVEFRDDGHLGATLVQLKP